MLDLQAEWHDRGQFCADLYESVAQLKRRHDLHPCAVRPRDGWALRRASERELVQELVKRFRDLPTEQQRRLPALLNSLAQLEVVIGDFEASQRDFQEVACLVADPISQAEAYHNVYRTAVERRAWDEALAALRHAVARDAEAFEPFPFAHYDPQRILGAGSFGVSFLCREQTQGRLVVVKALRAEGLDRDLAILFREFNNLKDLDYPVFVRIHDCAYAHGEASRPYLVLEYVEGQTLAEYVAQHGPLTPQDWLPIAWLLARALQAAHSCGVLHRSLRPSAVLLAPGVCASDPERQTLRWRVKLLDTGLALKRALIHAYASNPEACAQTTLGRSVAHTIPFAPIEALAQPKGQVWVGPHSDIYSFGKLCIFALTGRTDPIFSPTPQQRERKKRDEGQLLPAAWRQLLADCTAWTTSARPEHFGLVLYRLSQLPGAGEYLQQLERDLHQSIIAEYTAALESDPFQVSVLAHRGNAYARQGAFDNAIADYTQALELQPADAALYRRRALIYLHNRAFDAAIADCTEALRREPHNIEAHANRGLAYAQKGDYARALADYNEALRWNPRDPLLLFNRGNTYYAKGDYDRALADYTEVIRLVPHHLWAYTSRGKIYMQRGDAVRALADFTEALRYNPADVHALNYRGQIYAECGRLDDALADFTTAIRLEPSNASAYYNRGKVHAQRGELEQALVDFTEALRLHPQYAAALSERSRIHALLGHYERAIADNLELLDIYSDDAAAYNNLARLWMTSPHPEQREPTRAIEYARRACELTHWQVAVFIDTLAAAYAAAGRFLEASEYQRRALELAREEEKAEYRARLKEYEAKRGM